MTKRLPGRKLLEFNLFGIEWQVREVKLKHEKLDPKDNRVFGMVHLEERVVYIGSNKYLTLEQQQQCVFHEIQHIIEDHFSIDHEYKAENEQFSESRTDSIACGWLYVVRGCPEVIEFVTKKTM